MAKLTLIYCRCLIFQIWKTPNISTDADRSTNTKKNCGGGTVRTDVQRYRQTDGHTDRRRGGGSHFTCQPITCDMSVQCNAMQPSSIGQLSTVVGWLTKKYKEVISKRSSYRAEILHEALEVQELQRNKFLIFCVNLDQFTVIILLKKPYKMREKSPKWKLFENLVITGQHEC